MVEIKKGGEAMSREVMGGWVYERWLLGEEAPSRRIERELLRAASLLQLWFWPLFFSCRVEK